MSLQLFDSTRMPYRDAFGFAAHPDLDLFTRDTDTYDEDALARSGFVLAARPVEGDEPALADAYDEGDEHAMARWEPTPPVGDGWRLAAVYDTENGPIAVFVRRLD